MMRLSLSRTALNVSLLSLAFVLLLTCRQARSEQPTFERDVMAVLSKAGCNMGTCHGNLNGKGGLQLSLRGQDAEHDYLALTHQLGGRRINRNDPAQSLILLKPLAEIAHEGGKRFALDSPEYRILLAWIRAGQHKPQNSCHVIRLDVTPVEKVVVDPADSVQLQVTAEFAGGEKRDVTRLATYEPSNLNATVSVHGRVQRDAIGETAISVRYLNQQVSVRLAFLPGSDDFRWEGPTPANYIDQFVFAKLQRLRVNPAQRINDHGFVRRAFLDTLGRPPNAEEAMRLVDSSHPDKRNQLIDSLLSRPEFADHWALKWSDLLRNEEKLLDKRGVETFHRWIRQCFADGMPLNKFVAQLVAATGSTYEHPPANYYRPIRDPLTRGETTARLFLGIRLQCAKCHNHPFDRWTQDDYYSWAGLFAQVDYELVENKRRDKFDKNEFVGEQRVILKTEGEVTNARTGAPAEPRFLSADGNRLVAKADRLQELADWLTDPKNHQFAAAQANRIWYHLMGRGLVDPVDDFRVTNPASHPELLDALANDLVRHGYDVRHLVRSIMRSRTYQIASTRVEPTELADANYARVQVRRLTAEQLLDAQHQFLATWPEFNGYDRGIRAIQLAGVQRVRRRETPPSPDDRFLTMFGKPQRLMACECERSDETTLSQAFYLISGEGLHNQLAEENRLSRLLKSQTSDEDAVRELYWSALSRAPSAHEMSNCVGLLSAADDRRAALQDLAWALANSKEFMFRY